MSAVKGPYARGGRVPRALEDEMKTVQNVRAEPVLGSGLSGLADRLFAMAAEDPGALAFRFEDETWTRGQVAAAVERTARRLLALGLRPGDRLVLHLTNGPELAIGYFACFATGIIAAPLKPESKAAELSALIQRLQPAFYIGHRHLQPHAAGIDDAILPADRRLVVGSAADLLAWLRSDPVGPAVPASPDLEAPAVLLTTSGTTGEAKFVTHSQATLNHSIRLTDGFVPRDGVKLAIGSSMSHMTAFFTTVRSLATGAPFSVIERFDPDRLLDVIERDQCTLMIGMAYMFSGLIDAQAARPRNTGSIRAFMLTGDAVSVELQQRFKAMFGLRLASVWGMTEVVGSMMAGPVDGSVCTPAPDAEFRLVDERDEPVPPGETGELLLRGPNIALGYWIAPDRVDSGRRGGWFPSGDLMHADAEGNLWFVSRKKELIIRGGINISPLEVEHVLTSHPAVRDAAAIGVPDAVLGQRVRALVHLAGDDAKAELAGILAYAAERLTDYKVPEVLKVVPAIPRNALGKIDRRAAAALA